jgi:hypothetical protein
MELSWRETQRVKILKVDNKKILVNRFDQNTPASQECGTAHTAKVLQYKKMTAESCKHRPNVRKSLKPRISHVSELALPVLSQCLSELLHDKLHSVPTLSADPTEPLSRPSV